jgi:hypothetical protein
MEVEQLTFVVVAEEQSFVVVLVAVVAEELGSAYWAMDSPQES